VPVVLPAGPPPAPGDGSGLPPALGFVGDVHGDTAALSGVLGRGGALGVTEWVLLGDLEYRPDDAASRSFLDGLPAIARDHGARLRFVRGNHDDASRLDELAQAADGTVEASPALELLPDGHVFELAGLRFLAAGGASTPAAFRPHDWSAAEVLGEAALGRCYAAAPVDVVLAHDCPLEVPLRRRNTSWRPGNAHRERLSGLARALRPRWWISGHYHERVSALIDVGGEHPCRVEVLNRSGSGDQQFVVVTLDALRRSGDDPALRPRRRRSRATVVTVGAARGSRRDAPGGGRPPPASPR